MEIYDELIKNFVNENTTEEIFYPRNRVTLLVRYICLVL